MDAKLCWCLTLIILGTLSVQGEIPNNNKMNPLEVFARQPSCDSVEGYCADLFPCAPGFYPCVNYCPDVGFICCCPIIPNRK